MIPPRKPFPGYKWRWATLTPTEGLNEPPIYLGVLRVLEQNQGKAPSSPDISEALLEIERETRGRVETSLRLHRSESRNLIRNSGQYWKALGLLTDARGKVELTDLGTRLARGGITKDEFSALTIKTLKLPNRNIQNDADEWERAELEIRPLQLILEILEGLTQARGSDFAYLTPPELVKIVIPLAGTKAENREYLECLILFRDGRLDLSQWPDCSPAANDKRMAREFFLFLAHYGYCKKVPSTSASDEKFVLEAAATAEIDDLLSLDMDTITEGAIDQIRTTNSSAPAIAERRRVTAQVLLRPSQGRFRRDILQAYGAGCLLTGERIPEALEASHIIPVSNNGIDAIGNGICLRADIHNLFDAGHIRIATNGAIAYSEAMRLSTGYRALPATVAVPRFVLRESLEWRWKYY